MTFLLVVAAAFACTMAARAQSTAEDLRRILSEKASFLPAELESLDRGDVVVRAQETNEKQEIAVTGVVRIKGLPEIPMEAFRASLAQRSNKARTTGGKFSSPPEVGDLASFELSDKDIKDLRKCRPAKCDVNLSAEAIERFQTEVNWDSPDHAERANALMREILIGYVRGYKESGDKALGRLGNRRESVDLAAAHRTLLKDSLFIKEFAPKLHDYLERFPAGELPETENEFSWSIVDFGLKPMVTLSHFAAHSFTNTNGPQRVLAAKQFYANHYLDSSLTFTFLLRVAGPEGPETYLIFSDRSRSDALGGFLGDFARKVVTNEVLERVENVLHTAHWRLLRGISKEPEAAVEYEQPGIPGLLLKWAKEPLVIIAALAILALAVFRLTSSRPGH